MRANMDPLTPTTSTLSPAIAHIAETASSLAASLKEREEKRKHFAGGAEKEAQRQTVKWVLDTPRRLREEISRGEKEAAERDWEEVRALLDKWKGVGGAEDVRLACEKAFAERDTEVAS